MQVCGVPRSPGIYSRSSSHTTNKKEVTRMAYRLQLDTKRQLFIVVDPKNKDRQTTGVTAEQAIARFNEKYQPSK